MYSVILLQETTTTVLGPLGFRLRILNTSLPNLNLSSQLKHKQMQSKCCQEHVVGNSEHKDIRSFNFCFHHLKTKYLVAENLKKKKFPQKTSTIFMKISTQSKGHFPPNFFLWKIFSQFEIQAPINLNQLDSFTDLSCMPPLS